MLLLYYKLYALNIDMWYVIIYQIVIVIIKYYSDSVCFQSISWLMFRSWNLSMQFLASPLYSSREAAAVLLRSNAALLLCIFVDGCWEAQWNYNSAWDRADMKYLPANQPVSFASYLDCGIFPREFVGIHDIFACQVCKELDPFKQTVGVTSAFTATSIWFRSPAS